MRFALRSLLKSPGFTLVAVLTLALAIGVNSAMFSMIHGIILRPLIPVRPAEVVNLFTARKDASKDYREFSHAEFTTLQSATDTFAGVAALNTLLAGIGQDETMRRSFAFMVSGNYFSLLGTTPAAGRFFNEEESRPNANLPVVIVSHALWQRSGGQPDFIGSTLRINGQPHTVIGVTRKDFSGLNAMLAPDVWLPLGQYSNYTRSFGASESRDLADPNNFTLTLTARLAPGVTPASLPGRLPAVEKMLDAVQPPEFGSAREIQFEPPSRYSISTAPSGDSSAFPLAATLLGMSVCVLLIACLNLANMLLARGAARAKEIAVRLALGASRFQIIRQLVVEGLVLALLGGALGLLLSLWSNDLLLQSLGALFGSMNFSLAIDPTPGFAVLGATFGFCLLATLIFSVGPALRASRTDLVTALKQTGAAGEDPGHLNRFFAGRHVLVMAQIALSFMLLFSSGLFVRGALAAGHAPLGFNPANQLVAEIDYSLGDLSADDASRALYDIVDRVRAQPGVIAAALGSQMPYGNITSSARMVDAREPATSAADAKSADAGASGIQTAVTPGYFEAMGVELLRGRDFTAAEARDEKSPRVVIIDASLAKKLFPDDDALGRSVRYTQPPADGSPAEMEIVGICAPFRHDALQENDRPRLMVPYAQNFRANTYLHVRTALPVEAAVPALRDTLRSINPTMPLLGIRPVQDFVERNIQLWIVRLGAILFAVFGGIALLLAVVGVYGVKAYVVARRTREIGIRMAVGAQPRDIFNLIMGQGLRQTLVALAVGALLALGAGQLLGSMLYQVSPRDPLALGAAALVLATAALIACFLPARRATRVSPNNALRTE
jgi:putative ABC transport system permease protein